MGFSLVGTNSSLGISVFVIQCVSLAISEWQWAPDLIFTGIWGGAYLIMLGLLSTKKMLQSTALRWMAIYGVLTGFALIGSNSWSLIIYEPYVAECDGFSFGSVNLCVRLAIDCFMIINGIFIVLINGFICGKASSLANK